MSRLSKESVFSIFFAMGRPFGEWKIPKQENKDTTCENSRLQKEGLSRKGAEECSCIALRALI